MPPRRSRSHHQAFERISRNELRKAQIPGMQVAVIRHGKVVFLETFGLADVENSVPAKNSTLFQIASITKALVGVAVMQLVENGKLPELRLSGTRSWLPPGQPRM